MAGFITQDPGMKHQGSESLKNVARSHNHKIEKPELETGLQHGGQIRENEEQYLSSEQKVGGWFLRFCDSNTFPKPFPSSQPSKHVGIRL